jgi:hypothetical protein
MQLDATRRPASLQGPQGIAERRAVDTDDILPVCVRGGVSTAIGTAVRNHALTVGKLIWFLKAAVHSRSSRLARFNVNELDLFV